MRRAWLFAGVLLACDSRPSAIAITAPVSRPSAIAITAPVSSQPVLLSSTPETPVLSRSLTFCDRVKIDPTQPNVLVADCEGQATALWLSTTEDPQRHRPLVALYRLAEALSFRVVPRTEMHLLRWKDLLENAENEETRRWLATMPALNPDGTISAALVALPGATKSRATRWSQEEQQWSRLIENPEKLTADQQELARDWVEVLVLDYLSAAILRRTVEQDPTGRLWLLDNRGTFVEHPEAYAVDQILGRLKRCQYWPQGLRGALEQLNEAKLRQGLHSGSYDQWLVYRRGLKEISIRRRALLSWLVAHDVQQ